MFARRFLAVAIALSLTATPAAAANALFVPVASTVQENALKDGCKKRYAKNKKKYNECISGQGHSSENALIDGCYARYKDQRDKLKQCLGR
jgi:hypothetical protein